MKLVNGSFELSASEHVQINSYLKELARDTNRDLHQMFATKIYGPIRTKAEYVEVYDIFFVTEPTPPGEIIRIAQADYIAVAFYTSPDGETMFVRPGRRYATVSWRMVSTGMEFGWDDMAEAGWPMLNFYLGQAAEELARKRDARAKTVIDTSIDAQSGHATTCSDVLTRASVDAIIKLSVAQKFPVKLAVLSPATAMDMANWTQPPNSMWRMPEKYGEQVIQRGWISNYGGLEWHSRLFATTTLVYFGGDAAANGCYRFKKGGVRTGSDTDITKRSDRYVWDEKWGHYIDGGQALFRITIG